MLDNLQEQLDAGAHNLLVNCGQCVAGQTLLLIHETEGDGYYDPGLAGAVERAAQKLGLKTELLAVGLHRDVADPDPDLAARMNRADCTLFLARLGDQLRFRAKGATKRQIISYALDRDMLASAFGTVPYQAFDRLKRLINAALSGADEIRVTCPAGTDLRGRLAKPLDESGDVTRKRFPVSVFTPVPALGFRGRIAQVGFLTGTGSHYYQPYSCALKETLFIDFDGTRITGFDGAGADVKAARAHYDFVGRTYGIEALYMHSWHVGIHPGCLYAQPAAANFERWSGGAFGNPRLLHFHTCGAYPPGEISLNVLDPTIRLDGIALWQDGRLRPDLLPEGTALLDGVPGMRALFENPAAQVGLGKEGTLSFL